MATKRKTAKKATPRKEGVKADGTLKKGYRYVKGGRVVKAKATTTKKKTTTRNTPVSARTLCRQVVSVPGINKRTGQLLKGYKWVNGKPKKVAPKKKTVAKRKTTAKRK